MKKSPTNKFRKRRMGDTDGTVAVSANATDRTERAATTPMTRTGVSTSGTTIDPTSGATGIETDQKGTTKADVKQENVPVVHLTLKKAVELELKSLESAVESINADSDFMHKMINKRKDFLMKALQKLKCDRGTFHHTHNHFNAKRFIQNNFLCIHSSYVYLFTIKQKLFVSFALLFNCFTKHIVFFSYRTGNELGKFNCNQMQLLQFKTT